MHMSTKEKLIFRVIPIVLTVIVLTLGVHAIYTHVNANNGVSSPPDVADQAPYDQEELQRLLSDSDPYAGLSRVQELSAQGVSFSAELKQTIDNTTLRFFDQMVLDASQKIRAGDFPGAVEPVRRLEKFFPENPRVKNLRFSITNVTPYDGVIEHIFFHPLIVYPERAFPKSGRETGQDLYMVTVYEFKKVIDELYKNGYVLVNINDLFDVTYDASGSGNRRVSASAVSARGQKPLVLSVDDINYYEYMIRDGQNFKLILDQNGKLCTYSKDMDGNEVISYDNEIMTIVDAFVEKHPDFSMNFAKGALGVTGYEGVLGWRVNDRPEKAANYEEEAAGLRRVVAKLKENGWTFASHSQGHRNTPTASLDTILEDTQRWDTIVKPFVGATPVYIYPYGAGVSADDPKFIDFQKHGFGIFCTVQMAPLLKVRDTSVVMARKNIDGIAFNGHGLDHMMNVDAVIDPVRPNVTRKSK